MSGQTTPIPPAAAATPPRKRQKLNNGTQSPSSFATPHAMNADPPKKKGKDELAGLQSQVHYDNHPNHDDDDDDPPSKPRNYDKVRFGEFILDTWFYSPYPPAGDRPASVGPPSSSNHPHPASNASASSSKHNPPFDLSFPTAPSLSSRTSSNLPQASTSTLTVPEAAVPARPPSKDKRKQANGHTSIGGAKGPQINHNAIASTSRLPDSSSHLGVNGTEKQNGAGGREKMLFVCDVCFKYLRTLKGYLSHLEKCEYERPPGRKVYEKGSYSIYEVRGSDQKLFCQNLSLFGKLFIDHKTIFFDVDGFMFYILTEIDRKKDHAIGYFSKEKISYDDFNLACIVTFPQYHGRGFGKMLMEFSYHLTKDTPSPGTPERPLSELGAIGYESFWIKIVLRSLVGLLIGEESEWPGEGRWWKEKRVLVKQAMVTGGFLRWHDLTVPAAHDNNHANLQRTATFTLGRLSEVANIRQDDLKATLEKLGFLTPGQVYKPSRVPVIDTADGEGEDEPIASTAAIPADGMADTPVSISWEIVLKGCEKWRVRGKGVLDPHCCKI